MIRRTGRHYYHRHAGPLAEPAADWMSALLGWDDVRRRDEIAAYQHIARPPA